MSAADRTVVTFIGGTGYLALGVISLIIGYFLIRVALLYDPTQDRGWGGALGFLADLRYGRWALGVVPPASSATACISYSSSSIASRSTDAA